MRFVGVAALVAVAGLFVAPAAPAGTYDVVACAAASGINHSWTGVTNEPTYITIASDCPPAGKYSGLVAMDNLSAPGFAPSGASSAWHFSAPPNTAITALRYSRYLGKDSDNDWRVFGQTDEGATFDGC